jgi:predicted carbohydrate-binding protein with CBM5 and CBM33 domain
MLVRPHLAHLVCAGIAAPLLTVAVATAAAAHGAPLDPVSRSAACGSEGRFSQAAACQAARAGDEGQWFDQWDNVRVADVNGRDRETIPDGQLCSGGIDNFGGLDLARSDWPSSQVQPGTAVTVKYRATIPHAGTFRIYATKTGFDPKRPLRWADLDAEPFLTAKDPNFAGGAYTFGGTLPKGKVGRHLLFTIWQNSSTPDTYYSCSDVVFAEQVGARATTRPTIVKAAKTTQDGAPGGAAAAAASASAAAAVVKSPASKPSSTPVEVGATPTPAVTLDAAENLSNEVAGVESGVNSLLVPALAVVGLLALAGAGGAVVVARRSRPTGRRRH